MFQAPELLEIRERLLSAAGEHAATVRRRRRRFRRAGVFAALAISATLAATIAGAEGVGPLAENSGAPIPIVEPGASAVASDLNAAPLADPASTLAQRVASVAASVGMPSTDAPRTVLTGLGVENWSLDAITTTEGAACVALGDSSTVAGYTCFPGFTSGGSILYDAPNWPGHLPWVMGIARPNVTQVVVHYGSRQNTTTPQHGFFFAEGTTTDRITEIDAVLDDGSTQAATLTPPPIPPAP
jgi:hypothetical protein